MFEEFDGLGGVHSARGRVNGAFKNLWCLVLPREIANHPQSGLLPYPVIRYLAEDTEAPEILEGAVDSASRAMDTPKSIEFFEHYRLTSVTREAIRRRRRNQRVEYVERKDLERLAGAVSTDVERQLDEAKLIELFRACLDPRGRAMFHMRVLHFDWRWI